jgi:DNA-3-methyladenine glycosylase II
MKFKKAENHLRRADPVMAAVIKRMGPCEMGQETDPWRALSSSIMSQQISVYAARAIRGRFVALFEGKVYPDPEDVLAVSDEALRGAGLSGNKVLAIRDLARHFADKQIDVGKFPEMTDDEIIEVLVPVRGIGRWTAEMFLLFSLHRPDVLAVDDQGLRNAMMKLYGLESIPKPAQMREIAAPWQPYRSVASWYLWRSLDNEPKIAKE